MNPREIASIRLGLGEQINAARFALQRGDSERYGQVLDGLESWVKASFDPGHPATAEVLAEIKELRDAPISVEALGLGSALELIRASAGKTKQEPQP